MSGREWFRSLAVALSTAVVAIAQDDPDWLSAACTLVSAKEAEEILETPVEIVPGKRSCTYTSGKDRIILDTLRKGGRTMRSDLAAYRKGGEISETGIPNLGEEAVLLTTGSNWAVLIVRVGESAIRLSAPGMATDRSHKALVEMARRAIGRVH